jgi:hypothetical protein
MELHQEFLNAFKLASRMRVRINESKCDSSVYEYKMNNAKAAFNYI